MVGGAITVTVLVCSVNNEVLKYISKLLILVKSSSKSYGLVLHPLKIFEVSNANRWPLITIPQKNSTKPEIGLVDITYSPSVYGTRYLAIDIKVESSAIYVIRVYKEARRVLKLNISYILETKQTKTLVEWKDKIYIQIFCSFHKFIISSDTTSYRSDQYIIS